MKRVSLGLIAILLALGAVSPATAQNYPTRTIKVLISTAPGGLLDILPRILGQKISETTGQAVVIENKTGGNGAVAGAEFAKSAPDGYTLMGAFHGVNAILPHMTNLPFDPRTDFAPIVHFLTVPTILVVHPSLPVESVQDLIAYGKANPGKLTYASQGVGSGGHLGGELFKQLTGLDIAHVPFRGAAPAAQALVGGQVSMMFDNVTLAAESVKAGRIRALGVAAKSRNATLPDVPTLAEKGQPLEVSAWFGLMAPTGTPPAIINWLNREANTVFSQPDVRNRFLVQGAELPLGTPDDFRAFIDAEYRKWGPVITKANIRIN
jgi:tripartite-type tricarboxylate transporter receptor subunit TctC